MSWLYVQLTFALIDLRLLKIPAELNVSLLDGDSPLRVSGGTHFVSSPDGISTFNSGFMIRALLSQLVPLSLVWLSRLSEEEWSSRWCLGPASRWRVVPSSSHLDNDKDYVYVQKEKENKCEWRRELDLHMDLFWSADGQCLGEASDMPMTSERGGWGRWRWQRRQHYPKSW